MHQKRNTGSLNNRLRRVDNPAALPKKRPAGGRLLAFAINTG